MDDSDQDFTDLCSRLLKRVRRKGAGDEKKPAARNDEQSSSSPCKNPPKRRKKTKEIRTEIKGTNNDINHVVDFSQPACVVPKAKDAVIRRMQQFKRETPEKLLHTDTNQPITTTEPDGNIQHTDDVSSDEALALQLQRELDRESRAAADVEDGGLFFCQICQKDLTTMSPQLRTQHINRCLDAGEVSAPSSSHHSHPRPHVPECPICGKCFKSEKSRSVHLKRCSTDMGVSPNDLLQALRRQATDDTTEQTRPVCITKRKNGLPAKKKSKKKGQELDEDTMMALALSRSLLEQEREKEREMVEEREIQAQISSPSQKVAPLLQWRPAAGKGRGKRRKGACQTQPSLLLIQDPQTALNRLQERVSALLLRSRPPSPPTPTLSPSVLPVISQNPLWFKSALHNGGPDSASDFYTSELGNFIQPLIAAEKDKLKPVEVTLLKEPSSETVQIKCTDQSQTQHRSAPSPFTNCSGTPGTQALQDLVELAEEGMTLTQYGYTIQTTADKDDAANELPSSGFVPETTRGTSKAALVSVSKLTSDLSGMVNNPQLSDVQLQVDSGDVFFTHSFMLYTRCPLLANMVHDSGFGVQEEGMPVVQRVLLGDVPGVAVLAFLQYLYTAQCSLTYALLPHVQQLANRFCLPELQQQCEDYTVDSGEPGAMFPAHLKDQVDQNLAENNFLELLQSMWQHEESETENEFKENSGEDRTVEEGERIDGEFKEERVDEEELDEIYDFAATQKKMLETETEDDEADANKFIGNEQDVQNETSEKSVASFHSNEQGVDGTEAAMVTSPAEIHKNQNEISKESLDKSYDRLFSQSVGVYTEPSHTPASVQRQHYNITSHRTPVFRPSCVSEVIDLSISPPPSSEMSGESSFPVPGVSPFPSKSEDTCPPKEISSSQIPSSPSKSQVELVVLSDSDDDMDIDRIAHTENPQSTSKSLSYSEGKLDASQGHTDEQVNAKVTEADAVKLDQSEHHNESVFDGSAEVSWLVPATPVVMRDSSAQTCVSMRRTQLFPESSSSSSSSSSVDRSKPSSSFEKSEPKPGCQTPLSQITSKLSSDGSHASITIGRPTPIVPQPSSSTPLHLDSSLQRQIPFSSPVNNNGNNFSLSQGKGGLLSLQLESSPKKSEIQSVDESSNSSSERISKTEVTDENYCSPQVSFCDEPPIAFDDSWGLDGGVESQKPCFSLRLDSSEGTVSPPATEINRCRPSIHTTPVASTAGTKTPELSPGQFNHSLPDPDMWDDWEENKDEPLPLSQRLAPPSAKRVAELRTPVACRNRNKEPLVPITPMPGFSDMDTPDLKNRLNKFGVRPLPKKQMILKLKEIHQYTHQLESSESDGETSPPQHLPHTSKSVQNSFKQPTAPPAASQAKQQPNDIDDHLSSSQNSTSSNADSDRSNPELCVSEDDDSDTEGTTASQAVIREKDKLLAVRQFILSDPKLYKRVLQYQPLPLGELQASLKAAGIRLGAAKLLDFLDSQCITFSTAKQGQSTSTRRKPKRKAVTGGGADKAAGRGRKKTAKPHGVA